MSGLVETRCARHPDARARSVACDRCGDYLCEACFGETHEARCAACRRRTGEDRVPWERPGMRLGAAWYETTRAVVMDAPATAARAVRGEGLARPFTYWLTVPLVLGALLAVASGAFTVAQYRSLVPWMVVVLVVGLVLSIVLAVLGIGALTALAAVAFHVVARACGGRGSWSQALRVVAYQAGVALWLLPSAGMAVAFPVCFGWLIAVMAGLGLGATAIIALQVAAREAHGLDEHRAWAAALAPGAAYLVVVVVAIVVAIRALT